MRRKTYSCDACGLPAQPDRLMRVMYDGSLLLCPACLELDRRRRTLLNNDNDAAV